MVILVGLSIELVVVVAGLEVPEVGLDSVVVVLAVALIKLRPLLDSLALLELEKKNGLRPKARLFRIISSSSCFSASFSIFICIYFYFYFISSARFV